MDVRVSDGLRPVLTLHATSYMGRPTTTRMLLREPTGNRGPGWLGFSLFYVCIFPVLGSIL